MIRPATFPEEADLVRMLFREYAAALGFDLCFQGFEKELMQMPGRYAEPRGRVLLAVEEGKAVGCIALRPQTDDTAEAKRLYVRPEARGKGIGRQLLEALIEQARLAGYRRIVLDTHTSFVAAVKLVESLGFRDIPPYYANPIADARFLSLDLGTAPVE